QQDSCRTILARFCRDPLPSAQAAAKEILPVVTPLLQSGVPYAVLSHSFGVWISFELLRAVRRVGPPMPRVWCLSAMPHPDVPHGRRPWRQQRTLGDADFKDEVRGWDVNEVVSPLICGRWVVGWLGGWVDTAIPTYA
ncbi:hypothetical protein Vretimale_13491, partial [Volvox reticuliferus]